jgi:DNA-binding transcriptional MocR family regulator
LRTFGWQALTYGYEAGPAPLIEWLCERLGETDARAPVPDEVFVTAGASQDIELVSAMLARPGDAIVVDSPTYHLALRILADRDGELVGAPAGEDGIDPAATGALLETLRRKGRRVPLLYLVPTFANPTGVSLSAARRRALVDVARDAGTVPHGGWFLRLRLPDGMSATGLLSAAEAHGVSFVPGGRFYAQPGGADRIRLSSSMYNPQTLAEAARRLNAAFTTPATGYR